VDSFIIFSGRFADRHRISGKEPDSIRLWCWRKPETFLAATTSGILFAANSILLAFLLFAPEFFVDAS